MTSNRSRPERDERLALGALGSVLVITVAWWALALWPVPGETPGWLELARSVCFNAGPDGMPDASGWMMLIGQPLGMVGFLALVWPGPLAGGLTWMGSRPGGRAALGVVALGLLAGLWGAGARVASAAEARAASVVLPPDVEPEARPRQDREPPPLDLVDQGGAAFSLEEFRGRPVLLTFAFGNCHDICPLVVRNAREVRDRVWGAEGAALVVVTLDPWRDTPARLPQIAARWELAPGDRVLGGEIEAVEAALDAWEVPRSRDLRTGDVAHPPLVHLIDAEGRIAFTALGGAEALEVLARRM